MPPIGRVTKPAPKVAKRKHQAAVFALRREEGVADLDREEAVGDEIVELEHVADGCGKSGAGHADVIEPFGFLRHHWSSEKNLILAG